MHLHQDASKSALLFLAMAALGPESIITIGSFPITNTIINTIFIDALLLGSVFYLKDRIKKIPGKFQNLVEIIIETFYNLTESIAGKNTAKIFPWFITFFLFILVSNWSGLIPGHGSIGFHEAAGATHAAEESHAAPATSGHGEDVGQAAKEETAESGHLIPIMRNATSDLNVTLALALISLITTHILAVRSTGFRDYISRFISFNPILLFVGLLEIVSEFTKIISLSFRLFGNIFAGEVVLSTISSLFAFVFPVPFIMLEVIVGLVQALVFSMLTMVFMSVLMTPHHAEEGH
jgi:F-type H+-transporting ATPase subunit a